ncbi:MAG: hypothetical protein KBG20_15855 [Caldilineaceae bacterium]|nr:hypothetical protein [Caldilineaceae bacterium]MBP8110497.1 hypothetical protein [Caldilineaceae bacterium]MBP8124954.1 hypothetical protein [Caldilineaceae bacterium]MBP9073782.1 hypothetical protein [Caldilineaceae bacterium]
MNENRNLFDYLSDWWERRQDMGRQKANSAPIQWLPAPGNIIFAILLILGLFWVQRVGALNLGATVAGTSTGTIAYQGRLADSAGTPLTETLNMSFRLYAQASGGTSLWTEQWTGSNGVQVSDGLFNVMLGSLEPISQNIITGNDNLFLGITAGTDGEMSPRVQLGSVPFAVQALTVPDGSITTEKLNLADGLDVTGSLQVDGEIRGDYFCGGHTNTDGTDWQVENSTTIFVDVNTSACNFPTTPMYFTSLGGSGFHWMVTGVTSIYFPTATGFRVYILSTTGPIDPSFADTWDWHIQWYGIKEKLPGVDQGLSTLP